VKNRRLRLVVLLAALAAPLVVLGSAPDAHGTPCAGSVEEARRHMDRGFAFFDKKEFAEAASAFDAAYRAQPFSAFLCNAAMAYQEALDYPNAIQRYRSFLAAEPNPPDLARIKKMLAWLEATHAARLAAHAEDAGDAGAPGSAADAGAAAIDADAGAAPPLEMTRSFRSQVIVVSDPPDAPLTIFARKQGAPPWVRGAQNPGWERVTSGVKTPHDVSLGVGDYHIVIDAFKDYKRSETDIQLVAGHLYEFKANLSQGEFMGFLRVLSPAAGAAVWLDDPPPHKKPPWGRAPHGELVESGEHRIWIEAPGYETASEKVIIEHGTTHELTPALTRVGYGYLRVDGNAEEVTVKIDGAARGVYTPVGEALRIRLPAGSHRLELEASGRKTYAGDIDVPRGQELGVHGRLSFKPARSSAVVSGALAVGAVVGGVALFKQQPAPETTMSGTLASSTASPSSATLLKAGGAVSLGVAALLGFSTVYSVVSDPTPPSRVVLDKPKDLDDSEVDVPAPAKGPRRVFGTEARAAVGCKG
jgi:hypothetical protein